MEPAHEGSFPDVTSRINAHSAVAREIEDAVINADKVSRWRDDVQASVALYNSWFFDAAPQAYRDTRQHTIDQVKHAFIVTQNMLGLTPTVLAEEPAIISALRMMTAPPIARDRLIGLAGLKSKNMVKTMEANLLPPRMSQVELMLELRLICSTIERLVDRDLLAWVPSNRIPTQDEVDLAAMVVADRLCGAVADPIIRNAQEQRQLAVIADYLNALGYEKKSYSGQLPLSGMPAGTYSFRQVVSVGSDNNINMPIDVVIQPKAVHPSGLPLLIECKSAGDFTNTNKRRKEEAQKLHQLRAKFGEAVPFYLFLNGYFDAGYLGYEAAEGIDWIWEHRLDDLMELGL